ncbi:precorrin-3B C(17)-methyltransferase [Lampropedia puyangensis]|uniref:Precorrin-3B C(17)-methyltransferase n=1 Tax=Lampropedia puyangensis TaxID=1330072 RepID=A0A4S8F4K9_9BURK|nr:precorrin-3B C(17)-methyltransferase [Lampropedia puyangensis]THU02017.1 precorrin-3B C(17)-methyltransferase [Lampropedia puyangensis]
MSSTPSSHAGWLRIVGLGPGDGTLITPQVHASIADATDALGYFPYVERLQAEGHLSTHIRLHASDNREEIARARHALQLAASGARVLMLSSGDPGVFAMAAAVFEALDTAAEADKNTWLQVSIEVQPGITAMLAAAARLGAPLGHDFCAINLSDNLKPWPIIEQRLRLAAQADFAMAFYNPRSQSRPTGFMRTLDVLRECCEPQRLIAFARNTSRIDERLVVCTLAEATPEMADMRTLVIVGSSQTRRIGPHIYTPRSYPELPHSTP